MEPQGDIALIGLAVMVTTPEMEVFDGSDRLAACARRGIPDDECAPSQSVATVTVGTSDAG